nr:DUF2497 domain-containing protein [Phyllobacterium phragmitis]
MEEILASIRRIIEDSDVVRQSVPPKPERPVAATPVRGEIAEFRRDPEPVLKPVQPAPNSTEADDAPEDGKARHAEDAMNALAARIGLRGSLDTKISGDDEPAASRDAAPSPGTSDSVAARASEGAAVFAGVQPDFGAGLGDSDDVDEDDEPVLDASNDDRQSVAGAAVGSAQRTVEDDALIAAAERAAVEPAEMPSGVSAQAPQSRASVAADEDEEMVREDAPRSNIAAAVGPIISQATGRQVAAAFEDLSAAMRAEQRRSFDEVAEEILRPMLQDWLDNNLPGLVERLVREEIERVVRAGGA